MMCFPEHPWLLPARIPRLAGREVHVWRAGLDRGIPRVRQLARTLCPAERARADRFFLARDRNRFIVCRGILRGILSGYLKTTADQLRFCYGDQGKPRLAQEIDAGGLRFNLSHSDGMALLAFTRGGEVGIDVERVRADAPWEEIAAYVLSRGDRVLLRNIPGALRRRAFFATWTGKEAYLKARGQGLSYPLNRIDVSLAPLALRRVGVDEQEAARWSLRELGVGADYVAAVAVEGHDWQLRCWEWVHDDEEVQRA
jgi:4'-phosphopantetheinyl transferase